MKTIWKYELDFAAIIKLQVPKNAKILTVQIDDKINTPCVWIMVDTENEIEERWFELFGSGQEIKWDIGVDRKYIGTYQYGNGAFVGHVFEYTGV